jgi:hypothetical protein
LQRVGSCEKPQDAPIHLSKERTTMRACLQELLKRLEENHGNCAEALTKKAFLKERLFDDLNARFRLVLFCHARANIHALHITFNHVRLSVMLLAPNVLH